LLDLTHHRLITANGLGPDWRRVEKGRRACAGAPGLRSRTYFGGVGSAGRPAAFLLLAVFTHSLVPSARPSSWGLATGNGVSHRGLGGLPTPIYLNIPVCFSSGYRVPPADQQAKYLEVFNNPIMTRAKRRPSQQMSKEGQSGPERISG
jgi:hypothetical protein